MTTHAADANAHHVPPTGGAGAVSTETRLPVGTVALRLGWAQTNGFNSQFFTRVDNHPIDGAAEGTVGGVQVPPFPPALNTDTSLYLHIFIATAHANIADVRLSGGGGTLIGSISNGAAQTVEGVAGNWYVSNQRLSPGLSAFQISAIVGGDLIASQPWVTEQIAAIPAGGASTLRKVDTYTIGTTTINTWVSTAISPTVTATLLGVQFQDATLAAGGLTDVDDWVIGWLDAGRLRDGKTGRVNTRPSNQTRIYAIRINSGVVEFRGNAVAASESLKLAVWEQ